MALSKLYNLARMTTATVGGGTVTLGSAVPGFLSFASAGLADGETVSYSIRDGNNSEVGRGVYTASGTTLTRSVLKSTNSNSPISLSGAAEIMISPVAEDILTADSSFGVDNSVVRKDGTGKILQSTGVIIDDSNNISGIVNQALTGYADFTEIAAPASPAANVARLYPVDDGGTTKLAYKDNAGTVIDLGYFTQAGTGAVLRKAQDRARDTISVLDFIPTSLHASILDYSISAATDVSSYIQAAINFANGRKVWCPAGKYPIGTAISFTQNATAGSDTICGIINLQGEGHGMGPGGSTTAQKFVTRFLITFNTGNVFTATSNYPSYFKGIQFNTFTQPRTSGGTIKIQGPGSTDTNANSVIEECGFTGCYQSIVIHRCAMPTITRNYFTSWKQDAINVSTVSGIEGSGGHIHSNYFYGDSGSTTQSSCIVTECGYTNIHHNLILGASIGVNVPIRLFDAGAVRINDNWIENQGTISIACSSADGSKMTMLSIERNEFSNYAFVSNWTASITIADYSSGTDWLDDVIIANNVHRHSLDVNHRFTWVQTGRNVKIANEVMENLGTGSSTIGIDCSTFAGAALKAPFIIKDCIFRGTFGGGRYVLNGVSRLEEPDIFVTVQGSDVSLTNNITTAQNIFASANDVLTLMANTTYFFEGEIFIATGTTSHTTALGFVASSAFTSIKYTAELWSGTSGTISTTAASILDVNASTATVLNAASTAAFTRIRVRGIIRTNAATTMTPQVTFSAGPTGTCAVKTDSWLRLQPVGNSGKVFHGDWA